MTDQSTLNDPRWVKFNGPGLQCSCGETHVGMFPINMLVPFGWPVGPQGPTYEPDEALRMDGEFLSANYCVSQGSSFAIRMRLPLRILGAEPWNFTFTVWVAVNKPDFENFVQAAKTKSFVEGARAPGRLLNRLTGFLDSLGMTGTWLQQADGKWPIFVIHGAQDAVSNDHPLIAEQQAGVTLDRAFELFAKYGHEMRYSF